MKTFFHKTPQGPTRDKGFIQSRGGQWSQRKKWRTRGPPHQPLCHPPWRTESAAGPTCHLGSQRICSPGQSVQMTFGRRGSGESFQRMCFAKASARCCCPAASLGQKTHKAHLIAQEKNGDLALGNAWEFRAVSKGTQTTDPEATSEPAFRGRTLQPT